MFGNRIELQYGACTYVGDELTTNNDIRFDTHTHYNGDHRWTCTNITAEQATGMIDRFIAVFGLPYRKEEEEED